MDKKPLVAIIAAGAVLFTAGYWAASDRSRLIEPAAAQSRSGIAAMSGMQHHDFCADLSGRRLALATKFVTVDFDLSAEQIDLLDTVADSVLETAARPNGICTLSAWTADETDLPGSLASARAWVAAAQAALDDIEPPLNAFYGSLDDVQKRRLSAWMAEGRQRHGD